MQWFLKSNIAMGIALLILLLFSLAYLRPGNPTFVVALFALIVVATFLVLVLIVTKKILSKMVEGERYIEALLTEISMCKY